MKYLSIRWRLTLWYAAAMAIVLTTFGLMLQFLTRQQLIDKADSALREELRELVLEVQLAGDRDEFTRHAQERFFRHDVYDFLIVSQQHAVVFASSGISDAHIVALAPRETKSDVELFDLSIDDESMLRVAASTVDGPIGTVSVIAMTSLRPLLTDLLTLRLLMLVLVPVGVLLALSGGYFLAARALAPVEEIARVAGTITIANLSQRIDIVNPRDELGQLASTLNSLIARLESAVDQIQRFTADASHELRTPLASIRAEAESALRMPRSPEEYQRTLGTVVAEATQLGRLADELLSLSRHDAGIVDCQRDPIRVDALLLDVVDHLRILAGQQGVAIEAVSVSIAEARGDDLLLGQALSNVIENAIKYTPRGGTVAIQCEQRDGSVLIQIQDTGIGIPESDLERVFDRFYRVDRSRQCATGGAGLGLAITRSAIQLHGGTIQIESQLELGTKVTIQLPAIVEESVPGSMAQQREAVSHSPAPSCSSVTHRLIALAITMLFCGVGCQPGAKSDKPVQPPAKSIVESQLNKIQLSEDAVHRLGLQTAVVEERSMTRQRPYGAEIVLPTGSSVVVSAPLAGKIIPVDASRFLDPGQKVDEGKELFKLLPLLSPERSVLTPAERIRFAEARNTLAQSRIDAEALVQQASVQVDAAKIALERADRLLKDKAGTARAVDEAMAQLQLAEKSLAAAKARKQQVDGVKLDEEAGTLEPIPVTSPLTGIIRAVNIRPSLMIAAGAPMFEVMTEDSLWIKVPIYVGDVDELDLSKQARVTLLDGRLSDSDLFVEPATLPPTSVPLAAAVDVYYVLPNARHQFHPGQKVAAHITMRGEAKQVALPWRAIIHDVNGGQWVYVKVGDREFVRRRVDVAWVDGEMAAIRRGIQPGVWVVVAGAAEIAGFEFGFAK